MLVELLGNKTAVRVLSYLLRLGEAHPSVIARDLTIPLNMIQKQLQRFERGSFLTSVRKGKIRRYRWNKAHPLFKELRKILTVGLSFEDPADGTYLTLKERVSQAEALSREGEILNQRKSLKPFVLSFGSFRAYENWEKGHPILT